MMVVSSAVHADPVLMSSSVRVDSESDWPQAVFVLSIQPQVASREFAGRWGASLTCDPTRGAHKSKDVACGQLREAEGRVENIPPVKDAACTLEYLPVEVRAEGFWRGYSRTYAKVFANPCLANSETGGVLFAY